MELGALPPAVVVHGRRGPNSSINGVYIRDLTWQGQIGPCYRRAAATGQKGIFLYFEGEWRMGPSPAEGSVWAFARSDAASPLDISVPWEVWDGQRVAQDLDLHVSDTSVIPSVLFLSFGGEGVPEGLRAAQGMLLQQPGLWDGRPYYQHRTCEDLFLLCSVAEGRWRLGPLPLGDGAPPLPRAPLCGGRGGPLLRSGDDGVALFARSASALPQEIVEPWHVPDPDANHLMTLSPGNVRLATTGSAGLAASPRYQHPRHIVVEGVVAGDGVANGVYRRAPGQLNQRAVYHKTDALRAASLWYAGGDWRLGTSIEKGHVWAYAVSSALSPLGINSNWYGFDGYSEEAVQLADANEVIPSTLSVAGEQYVQQSRLCDARPVYKKDPQQDGDHNVFLFFRVHEGEWWLGPVVGGTECYAKATGSRLRVVPDTQGLHWRAAAAEPRPHRHAQLLEEAVDSLAVDDGLGDPGAAGAPDAQARWWGSMALTVAVAAYCAYCAAHPPPDEYAVRAGGAWQVVTARVAEAFSISPGKVSVSRLSVPKSSIARVRRASPLACVVCLEAPREILLLPCRHVCCCKACADRLERCPMCRAGKTAFTKVFL